MICCMLKFCEKTKKICLHKLAIAWHHWTLKKTIFWNGDRLFNNLDMNFFETFASQSKNKL
jgi:hypothetical protein